MGYVLCFIKNSKTIKKERQTQQTLTPLQLHDWLAIFVRIALIYTFEEDIQQLQKHKELKGSTKLKAYHHF